MGLKIKKNALYYGENNKVIIQFEIPAKPTPRTSSRGPRVRE
jgi:hypothetical protein